MGCGRVGAALTVELAKAGHSVAIIDKRPEAFDRLPPGFQAKTIVGLGFDREVLEEAGIKEADAFVAVSKGEVEVIGVERGGSGFIPAPGATFQQGDVAHFVIATAAVDKLDTLLEPVAE